ncbi:hypothetical protein [Litorihabitans aurantiacus]|uniref:Uncharacterized protein n=1 Tax=Litorihabitans aurantiacus TaxID=1930061 RepID=A0AA37XGT1_9MICO|nr:hypothetical protein [Litorihabitans aurantiacus]GMA32587.1 hypothetical protein GCM10025875_25790 [Litorihabitans aurantiacus]
MSTDDALSERHRGGGPATPRTAGTTKPDGPATAGTGENGTTAARPSVRSTQEVPLVTRPAAPVPPRSRARDHLLGALLGLLGTAAALAALVLALARAEAAGPGDTAALAAVVAAGLVLALVAAWMGRSAVAPAVAGGAWLLLGLPGVLGTWADGVTDRVLAVLPDLRVSGPEAADLSATTARLLDSGLPLVIGLTLLALAVAAAVARRLGRAAERAEQRLTDGGAVTTPPRPRLLHHVGAIVLGLLGAVVVAALLDELLTGRIAPADAAGAAPVVAALALLTLGSLVQGGSGSTSSLGPAAAAACWLLAAVWGLVAGDGAGPVVDLVRPWLTDLLDLPSVEPSPWRAGPRGCWVCCWRAALSGRTPRGAAAGAPSGRSSSTSAAATASGPRWPTERTGPPTGARPPMRARIGLPWRSSPTEGLP